MNLVNREWIDMVQQEGTVQAMGPATVSENGELPCPACGTAEPLVEGACSDCGLVLE